MRGGFGNNALGGGGGGTVMRLTSGDLFDPILCCVIERGAHTLREAHSVCGLRRRDHTAILPLLLWEERRRIIINFYLVHALDVVAPSPRELYCCLAPLYSSILRPIGGKRGARERPSREQRAPLLGTTRSDRATGAQMHRHKDKPKQLSCTVDTASIGDTLA